MIKKPPKGEAISTRSPQFFPWIYFIMSNSNVRLTLYSILEPIISTFMTKISKFFISINSQKLIKFCLKLCDIKKY